MTNCTHCVFAKNSLWWFNKLSDAGKCVTVTCICVEDWKRTPEPQHYIHFVKIVNADADDKEKRQTTEHGAYGQQDIRICGDTHTVRINGGFL